MNPSASLLAMGTPQGYLRADIAGNPGQDAHCRPNTRRGSFMARAKTKMKTGLHWLRLLAVSEMLPEARVHDLTMEANELVAILTTIVKKLKAK